MASVEVIPYALPFKEPYVSARGTLSRREMVLLRIRDSDGFEGLGEAVPLSLRGGASLEQVTAELRQWGESSEGISGRPKLSGPARCAIGTAVLDRAAKRVGRPLWHLLGATEAGPVRCNATLTAAEPLQMAQQALAWEAGGFHTFKLKLGTGADLDAVRMVRDALGSEALIRVDANAAWDLETAKRILGEIEPLGIELAEQPVSTLEEMAELRKATSIPLAGDESIASGEDARRAAAMGACDYATVKLSKIGSPRLRAIARHLPIYLSSALDGPVGIAAAAHAAQALEPGAGLAHGLATQRLFSETIASAASELNGENLELPPGPGLGVTIDEAALERHRL